MEEVDVNDIMPQELLDAYYRLTGLDIELSLNNKTYKMSNTDFCSLIKSRFPKLCKLDTEMADNLEQDPSKISMCKAGLWCLKIPIKIENIEVGQLMVGRKIIKGKEDESKNRLAKSLEDCSTNKNEKEFFLGKLDEIDVIDEDNLNPNLLKLFYIIQKHIVLDNQRKLLEQQKIKALKELSQNMAHQFITPIQSILGNIENLITEYKKTETKIDTELLGMAYEIFEEIKKLALTADNLRDWVAIEHDIYRYEFHNVTLHPILMESIRLFRHEAKLRGIKINNPSIRGGPCPLIKISDEHMRRVFFNVLSNAVKYSFDGSPTIDRHIDIYCRREGKFYCTEFLNYGVGILPFEKDKIFEFGYRGILARDRSRYGSGLGLGAVKRIVNDHGGFVRIESNSKGGKECGYDPYMTSVEIFLPLVDEV